MLHFHEFLHTMYKYVLNSVVKFQLYMPSMLNTTPLYLGGAFFVDML